jgi:D-3-phosphoglycerate dehydrogenase / 2-oxoglutarate reductase
VTSRRIVAIGSPAAHAPAALDRLRAAGFEIEERYDLGPTASSDDLAAALDGSWGVIAGGERYAAGLLEQLAGQLRVIARPGAGYEAIDLDAATEHSIVVFTTPGVNRHAVADFTIGLMVSALRRLVALDADVRGGRWRATGPGRDLHGTTVGIVGLGSVGQTVASRLSGFECPLLGFDPFADAPALERLGIESTSLEALLGEADIVTLHVALTPETHHLIGARELERMRSDALLVNCSRGSVIDEPALVEALTTGGIAAAALDVFETEPLPADHALAQLPNVVLSSHVASHTGGSLEAMVEGVADGLLELAAGRSPRNVVNAPGPALRAEA